MQMLISTTIPLIAVIAFISYALGFRPKRNLKVTYVFVAVWLIWTINVFFRVLPAFSSSPGIPTPQTFFGYFMLPTLAVLYIMVIDITVFLIRETK